ncbi:hypothetical protein TSUD_280500 [Trifolium subterraneum]|uniref:Uncharacterized protein n=1 Tax=Trifolium subterraneum TaxID=3900 RepID=A0A2Z6PIU9_TRISU|nr:hypothetical protein TSUD_280500 [Trifolium subterraneum]
MRTKTTLNVQKTKKLFISLLILTRSMMSCRKMLECLVKTQKRGIKGSSMEKTNLLFSKLKRKVRGLKGKFRTSESFTKSHDKQAFELFKKISWINNGGNEVGEGNGKGKFGTSESFTKSLDRKAFELFKNISWVNHGGNEDGEENGKVIKGKSPTKNVTVKHTGSSSKNDESGVDYNSILNEIFRFGDRMVGLCALNMDDAKKGLESIEESKRAKMQERWGKLHIAELPEFMDRAQIVKDLADLKMQALKKLNH